MGLNFSVSRCPSLPYRPISILPIASKILEKHVSIHLYEYMTSYNFFSKKNRVLEPIIHAILHLLSW